MRVLTVDIPAPPPGEVPVGLLIGRPPETVHQSLEAAVPPAIASLQTIRAANAEQIAYFVPGTDAAGARFTFRIRLRPGAVAAAHFAVMDNQYTRPSAELRAAVRERIAGGAGPQDALARLVDFTASLFDYDHPKQKFYEGKDEIPLLTQLTKGSCQDINTFLISSLYAAEIPATYYSGYFFEAGKPQVSAWFHCWIATLIEGQQQDWDIAHHMKHGIARIEAGLNPVAGERLALSYGRGLRFPLPGGDVVIPQLGQPVWVYASGESAPAGAMASLSEEGEPTNAVGARVRETSQ